MSKVLFSLLLISSFFLNTACISHNDLINPPKWLIGYWINVNDKGIQKGLEVTENDILVYDSPGKSTSLKDHANSKNPPAFKIIDMSNKEYIIRVSGDLFVFEYISDEKINYDDKTYHRLIPE
ncbi:hypothetical protein [uncultured Winogradskyella sp.]|uniref:hypothetical protein n=1 Tax=uncultured Winogradskyella sp. TaxID=395353 RepID=UPI002629D533|nr:hypothetical protein [uncultured Winogradskyella sp.]